MTLPALTQNEQNAVDIERAFIGCCLLSSSAYAAAATAVSADQFIERWNATIWQAMGELAAAGSPSNNVTLIGLLGNPEVGPDLNLSRYREPDHRPVVPAGLCPGLCPSDSGGLGQALRCWPLRRAQN